MRTTNIAVAICGLALITGLSSAAAQADEELLEDVRASIRDAFDPSSASALYAATIDFTLQPEISTASYYIDGLEDTGIIDPRLVNYRIPLHYTFETSGERITPFVQGIVAYQDLSMVLPLLEDSNERVAVDWRSKGIDFGVGIKYRLSKRWTLLSSLNAGIADFRNEADYGDSALASVFQPIFEGIVFDWDTKAWTAGGSLAGRYVQSLAGFDFHGSGSLSTNFVRSFDESSSDIVIDDTART